MVVVVALVGGLTFFLVNRNEQAAAGEIFLEAAAEPGPNPFTTTVKSEPIAVTPTSVGGLTKRVTASITSTTSGSSNTAGGSPGTTSTSAGASTTAGGGGTQVASAAGGTPGLYGGTQDNGRCDPNQLVAFLEANPDKAKAWVDALNTDNTLQWSGGQQVGTTQIRAYVGELTPLTLTADVRVTNYGFVNGKPTPRQAVLQAGTAVLVDKYGVPRAKCACGNPLTKPVAVPTAPTYRGTPWPAWNPQNVLVVQQAPVIINNFTIVNLGGQGYLDRPAASTGGQDSPSSYTGPGSEPDPVSTTTTTERRGTTTTERRGTTTTTRRPTTTATTATTIPPSTIAAADFCGVLREAMARWAGDEDLTPENLKRLLAEYELLTASAPDEIKADMEAITSWIRNAIASGDLLTASPETEAAGKRVSAYITNVCGITEN